MKPNKLVLIMSIALATAAGSAVARDMSHDAYDKAFLGASIPSDDGTEMAGKASYGSSGTSWSGHDAYARAFLGSTTRIAPMEPSPGKAGYSSSGADGNASYRQAFTGD
ncbi:MAG: hypothetical protein JNJ60_14980 [Rhodocyclaceae bacterium]|nr:hypothetical protein [Rhodocyclaceae bacterium]